MTWLGQRGIFKTILDLGVMLVTVPLTLTLIGRGNAALSLTLNTLPCLLCAVTMTGVFGAVYFLTEVQLLLGALNRRWCAASPDAAPAVAEVGS